MIPIKTQKLSLFLSLVLPVVVVTAALLYTIRVCAAGQQAQPETRITEQSVAEARAAGAKAIKHATEFQWVASPAEDLGSPGAKTVRLARCPGGVLGDEKEYWVWIGHGAGRGREGDRRHLQG